MSFPHHDVVHGDPCDCTLHDMGLNCRRALTPEALRREMEEIVRVAIRSGFKPDDVRRALALVLAEEKWRSIVEVKL
jgi:hypothetical protein